MEPAGVLDWLEASPLSLAMRYSLWLYPIVEIVHIIGFAVLVGAVALFDLRVLGVSRFLPVHALGRHLLPWALVSLVLIVPAGLMLFSAHPHEFLDNPVFQLKLALIAVAGINALLFHGGVYRTVDEWNMNMPAPVRARAHALVSLVLWGGVISCGRLLAYT